MEVYYKGEMVGRYIADIVVNDEIILELKAQQPFVQNMSGN